MLGIQTLAFYYNPTTTTPLIPWCQRSKCLVMAEEWEVFTHSPTYHHVTTLLLIFLPEKYTKGSGLYNLKICDFSIWFHMCHQDVNSWCLDVYVLKKICWLLFTLFYGLYIFFYTFLVVYLYYMECSAYCFISICSYFSSSLIICF